MNLFVNMLLEWQNDTENFNIERILWIDPSYTDAVTIRLQDPKALPIWQKCKELEEAISAQQARILEVDPYGSLLKTENTITEKHKSYRDKAWTIIEPLIESKEQSTLFSHERGSLIEARTKEVRCTKKTIYKHLRRFWQGGQTRNTLLPSFDKCGAPGKQRRSGTNKRGRPSKITKITQLPTGINIDDNIRAKFSRGIQNFFENPQGLTLQGAFQKTLEKYFNKGYELSPEGALIPCLPPAHELPTFGQFRYWYEKERDVAKSISSRKGKRCFNLKHREVLGKSTQMAFGPGSVYQIDATIGDVYLVSSLDRTKIIGRPVIYVLIDVFSRIVTGLSVSLEGPSWLGAMQALENAAIDKVEFCREYGVEITNEDWPCHHLPEAILADRGEMEGYQADNLVKSLNVTVSNTPPYRADWKGIVERNFRINNDKFIHWLPGAVYKPRERGESDYRFDALLDLHEFRTLMILAARDHNKEHRMSWYSMDEFMIQDHVEPYPLDLWNWGIRHRAGHLRVKSRDILRLNLLPTDQASVTPSGIQFKGLAYSCDLAIREQWFIKAREKGRWKIDIAYDPRNLTNIYLRLNEGQQMECCQLIDKESTFRGCDFFEVLDHSGVNQHKATLSMGRKQQANAAFNAQMEKIVSDAKEKTLKALKDGPGQSKQAKTQGIRPNRQEERNSERDSQFWTLGENPQQGTDESNVLPLIAPAKSETDAHYYGDEENHTINSAIEQTQTAIENSTSRLIDRLSKRRPKTWNDNE
ncbi:MAG: transposase family protein [Tildeniella torsiva UHER 1998/13D]|jgi:hypothetical protein|nr:transposase family protein [Tildeniella torsiva UHER 1998/13D]